MRHNGEELSSDTNELGVHHGLERENWWHYDESEVGVHNNRATIWGLAGGIVTKSTIHLKWTVVG